MTRPTDQRKILDIKAVDDEETIRNFHETLLIPNFVPDEVIPVGGLVEDVRAGKARVLAATYDGALVAGAVGEWFERSRVQLLSYLVVHPDARGQGAGSRVLRTALRQWTEALRPLLIVGEVEDPRHFGDVGLGDPVARVRLYERLGVRSLPIPYAQPALAPGSSRVPHLILMVFAADEQALCRTGTIDGGIPERFLAEYFEATEGPEAIGDAEVQAMLAACNRPGGLPLLRAHELPEY